MPHIIFVEIVSALFVRRRFSHDSKSHVLIASLMFKEKIINGIQK